MSQYTEPHSVHAWFSLEWQPDFEIECPHDEAALRWDDAGRDCRLQTRDPMHSCGLKHWQDAMGMEGISVQHQGHSVMFPLVGTISWDEHDGFPILEL